MSVPGEGRGTCTTGLCDADGMGLCALRVGGNNIYRDRCPPTLTYTCIYVYSIYSSAPIFAGEPCSQCWGCREGSPAQGLPDHLLHGATGEHLGPTPLGMSWENRAGHRHSPADTWAQRHPARGLGLSQHLCGAEGFTCRTLLRQALPVRPEANPKVPQPGKGPGRMCKGLARATHRSLSCNTSSC